MKVGACLGAPDTPELSITWEHDMTLLTDLQASAERGAALLDVEEPGWFNIIDTDNLDMSIGYHPWVIDGGCVLSQINANHTGHKGTYRDALYEIFQTEERDEDLEAHYGFIIPLAMRDHDLFDGKGFDARVKAWNNLTLIWKAIILNRQKGV